MESVYQILSENSLSSNVIIGNVIKGCLKLLRIKTQGRKAPLANSQKVDFQKAHWFYI